MLTNNIWRCTAQAFSVGIWAKDPLGPKYQFYQDTYCLSKDISNRTPLRSVISNKQIRSRFLDMKLFNNAKETGHSHFKVTINTMFKVLIVTESFAWRCCFALCFNFSSSLWPGQSHEKRKAERELTILSFDNNDS